MGGVFGGDSTLVLLWCCFGAALVHPINASARSLTQPPPALPPLLPIYIYGPSLPRTSLDFMQTVCPPSSRCCYSESIAFMPHSYFANDYKQAHPEVLLPANLPSRAEVGLPEGKVVYSCANQVGEGGGTC